MLKNKVFLIIFYFLFFILSLSKVDAFLDEDTSSLDLYNNIDDGFEKLELKNYEVNLTYNGEYTVASRINAIMGNSCIDESITMEEFKQIAGGNTAPLAKNIMVDCRLDNGETYKADEIQKYFSLISGLDLKYTADAEEKSKVTYNISRLGLYSDGNTDNSPYDIIKDMEDINGIIFTLTDNEKYKGKDTAKLSDFLGGGSSSSSSSSSSPSSNSSSSSSSSSSNSSSSSSSTKNTSYNKSATSNTDICPSTNNASSYINGFSCSKTKSKDLSGLNYPSIVKVLNNIEGTSSSYSYLSSNSTCTTTSGGSNSGTSGNSNSTSGGSNSSGGGGGGIGGGGGSFSSNDEELRNLSSSDINSDSSDCDDFFCVKILYVKSEHSLFGGGKSKDKTIEGIIKNSNNHLYKYSNTDMTQKQMSLDNYEDNNKNKVLEALANINFEVQKREIPINNTQTNNEKEKKLKKNNPFSKESLLNRYYFMYNMQYERCNSINDFKLLREKKSINDSLGGQITNVSEKYKQYLSKAKEDIETEKELNNLLATKQRVEDIDYLNGIFNDLGSFTSAFEDYVKGLNIRIKKMNEKPAW